MFSLLTTVCILTVVDVENFLQVIPLEIAKKAGAQGNFPERMTRRFFKH